MKRLLAGIMVILMLSGCQLATEEKREDQLQDKLVGVFVTFEPLELDFDIEGYLNDHPGDVDYNDAARLQVHLGLLKRAQQQEFVNVLPTEVHVMRLGSIAIATNPFELFLDYGNQIKARSRAAQTFVVQLANGCEGYLPTEKAERGSHYSAYVSSGRTGHEGGNLLVEKTLDILNEMWDN